MLKIRYRKTIKQAAPDSERKKYFVPAIGVAAAVVLTLVLPAAIRPRPVAVQTAFIPPITRMPAAYTTNNGVVINGTISYHEFLHSGELPDDVNYYDSFATRANRAGIRTSPSLFTNVDMFAPQFPDTEPTSFRVNAPGLNTDRAGWQYTLNTGYENSGQP